MGERIWPKFRALTITLTLRSSLARRRRIGTVLSSELLSIKMCSYSYRPHLRHHIAHLAVELLNVCLFIVAGRNDAYGLQRCLARGCSSRAALVNR